MNISPNELRRQTVQVMKQVDDQIRSVEETAAARGVPATSIRDENGNWPMVSLLLAKSQCLATLVALQEPSGKTQRGR